MATASPLPGDPLIGDLRRAGLLTLLDSQQQLLCDLVDAVRAEHPDNLRIRATTGGRSGARLSRGYRALAPVLPRSDEDRDWELGARSVRAPCLLLLQPSGRLLAPTLERARKLLAELGEIEEQAAARLEDDPHAEDAFDAALVLMLFESVKLTQPDGDGARPKRRSRRRSR